MPDDARRFVVIGGGLAGLASAVWLAEAGRDVTLLERRGQLGGRTHAMRADLVDDVMASVVHPPLAELRRRDPPFAGLLYGGRALTATGPKVI